MINKREKPKLSGLDAKKFKKRSEKNQKSAKNKANFYRKNIKNS
ncbi:hypothetical protein [Anaerobacillus alkalidiazotrophicus]|nr:hypothetical protein [Anaerobacillus alkalidiazotrophicus]